MDRCDWMTSEEAVLALVNLDPDITLEIATAALLTTLSLGGLFPVGFLSDVYLDNVFDDEFAELEARNEALRSDRVIIAAEFWQGIPAGNPCLCGGWEGHADLLSGGGWAQADWSLGVFSRTFSSEEHGVYRVQRAEAVWFDRVAVQHVATVIREGLAEQNAPTAENVVRLIGAPDGRCDSPQESNATAIKLLVENLNTDWIEDRRERLDYLDDIADDLAKIGLTVHEAVVTERDVQRKDVLLAALLRQVSLEGLDHEKTISRTNSLAGVRQTSLVGPIFTAWEIGRQGEKTKPAKRLRSERISNKKP